MTAHPIERLRRRRGRPAWLTGSRRATDDDGSSLVIALLFITVVALAIAALITFAGGALLNTANLKTVRSREYAADTGTDLAIQKVRYGSSAYSKITGSPVTPAALCFGPATLSTSGPSTATPTANKRTVVVYCKGKQVLALPHPGKTGGVSVTAGATSVTTATLFGGSTSRYVGFKLVDSGGAFPTSATAVIETESTTGMVTLSAGAVTSAANDTVTATPIFERTITFFTCVAKGSTTPTCPLATGKPNYIVHAVVGFDDVTNTSHKDLCGAPHTGTPTCGATMSVEQWLVETGNR